MAPNARDDAAPSVWAPVLDMRHLFHPSLKRTTVLLTVSWFTLSFGWYGLILWIPTLFKDSHVDLNEYQVRATVAVVAHWLP